MVRTSTLREWIDGTKLLDWPTTASRLIHFLGLTGSFCSAVTLNQRFTTFCQ